MQQLHPRAKWLFFFQYILIAIPITLFVASTSFLQPVFSLYGRNAADLREFNLFSFLLPVFLAAIITIVIAVSLSYLLARLSYKYYRYELREEGFRKESGIIWKHYTTIPYERIQNVDIYRGILDRMLGLSDLRIQTAGSSGYGRSGGGAEGKLPGLDPQLAEQLRDDLIHRARQSKNQGL